MTRASGEQARTPRGNATIPDDSDPGATPRDEPQEASARIRDDTALSTGSEAPSDTEDSDTEEPPTAEAGAASDPSPTVVDPAGWRMLPGGRWVVGDEGRQPQIVSLPSPLWTRPDAVIDGASVGEIQFRVVSLRGLGHQQTATPRQDAYGFRITRDRNWFVGCVADGVSQARRSDMAADIACRETTTMLTDALEAQAIPPDARGWSALVSRLPWQAATDLASDAIVSAATKQVRTTFLRQGETQRAAELETAELPDRAAAQVMATTAIVLVIATTRNQQGCFPYAVLECAGDSSALILDSEGWSALTAVKNADNEIASSAVRPLPARVPVAPHDGQLESGAAIALITDGVGDPLGSGAGIVGRFLAECWAQPPDLLAFANQVAFFRRTFTDDRTALVVWGAPS